VCISDLMEQYCAQQGLRDSEERLQRFVKAGAVSAVFYRAGLISDCNDVFLNMLGKDRHALIGMPASHLFQMQDRDYAQKHMHLGRDTTYPAQLPHADGHLVNAEISGRSVVVNGQAASVAVVRDISQLTTINDALLRSQARSHAGRQLGSKRALHLGSRGGVFQSGGATLVWVVGRAAQRCAISAFAASG
jgi:PAS domain S-box-containing protein